MTKRVRQAAIGARLRESREEVGLSQDEAADHVKLTRQAVALWETGESAISAVQLGRLATLYGKSADYLIFGLRTVPVNDESACSQCANAKGIMQLALWRVQT